MDLYQILKRPLVTERTNELTEEGIYTFEVDTKANKNQIKQAVETIFKVEVVKVNTMRMPSKLRGRGRYQGYTAAGKKAIVRLKPGDNIDIFEVG